MGFIYKLYRQAEGTAWAKDLRQEGGCKLKAANAALFQEDLEITLLGPHLPLLRLVPLLATFQMRIEGKLGGLLDTKIFPSSPVYFPIKHLQTGIFLEPLICSHCASPRE